MKGFKEFIREEELPELPEFFVHWSVLARTMQSSKNLHNRGLVPKSIDWCLKNIPGCVFSGKAYRGTYLSDKKIMEIYTNKNVTFDLMPYYSFSRKEDVSVEFLDARNVIRNGALIVTKVQGIKSVEAIDHLREMIHDELTDVVGDEYAFTTKTIMDHFKNDTENFKIFMENFVVGFDTHSYIDEKEVLVKSPFSVKRSEINYILLGSERQKDLRSSVTKSLDKILESLLNKDDASEILKEIDYLRESGYKIVSIEDVNTAGEYWSWPNLDRVFLGIYFNRKVRNVITDKVLWLSGNGKYQWKTKDS